MAGKTYFGEKRLGRGVVLGGNSGLEYIVYNHHILRKPLSLRFHYLTFPVSHSSWRRVGTRNSLYISKFKLISFLGVVWSDKTCEFYLYQFSLHSLSDLGQIDALHKPLKNWFFNVCRLFGMKILKKVGKGGWGHVFLPESFHVKSVN